MRLDDTIAAISSAVGPSARMLVRVSGQDACSLAEAICRTPIEGAAKASRVRLHFSNLSVPSWLYVFRSPRSYTGEDLVEFHLPGNPLLAKLLLDHLMGVGARLAEPGEFTARAFFNGRLDLAEAEGVAATIAAGNELELAAARQLLSGELSRRLKPAIELLAETLALIEAGIDFVDEGVSFVTPEQVLAQIGQVDASLSQLLAESGRFEPLTHEPTIVLLGRPNAGKSTLLNALVGKNRAVVSEEAGTTRDALSANLALLRGMARIIDVAGLEDDGDDAIGTIERQMRERALRASETADVVALVQDVADTRPAISLSRPIDLVIFTKADVHATPARRTSAGLRVSAHTGEGLSDLRVKLDQLSFGHRSSGTTLALNARHVIRVEEARGALARATANDAGGAELIALDLREALDSLGRVLGAVTPDDLLGRIFSSFCIGK